MRRRSENTTLAFTQNLCIADGLVGLSLTSLLLRPTLTDYDLKTLEHMCYTRIVIIGSASQRYQISSYNMIHTV